jgi:hypothetical protein
MKKWKADVGGGYSLNRFLVSRFVSNSFPIFGAVFVIANYLPGYRGHGVRARFKLQSRNQPPRTHTRRPGTLPPKRSGRLYNRSGGVSLIKRCYLVVPLRFIDRYRKLNSSRLSRRSANDEALSEPGGSSI